MIPITRSAQIFHGTRLSFADGWRAPLESVGLAPGSDWSMLAPGLPVSQSHFTRCYRVVPLGATPVYCKFYVYSGSRLRVPWPLPSRAAVEAWGYQRFQALGIPTPSVVALGETRRLGLLEAATIVTREVPDALNLATFASDVWLQMPSELRRDVACQIADCLAKELRDAHKAGFYHQDLKWRNVLVRKSAGAYQTVWIDCPRAARRRILRRRGRILDLSCLARLAVSYLSASDRLRFVHAYLGMANSGPRAKSLYRRVDAHLARRPPQRLAVKPFRIGYSPCGKADGPLVDEKGS